MSASIKPLVAGNWKMNGLRASLGEIAAVGGDFGPTLSARVDVMICPPAPLLYTAAVASVGTPVTIGAQDCHVAASGAHTGDISPEMLRDAGASAVIVGHSERRADHGESDEDVRAKAQAAWRAGLVAIICLGESEGERKAGTTLDVIARQLSGSVPDGATAANTVIAYEPIWAIGTGLTPTASDVAEVHAALRKDLESRFGVEGAAMRLLYGGSVKPGNAAELMAIANVNGALVGGASLKAQDFLGILAAYGDD
ncbi:triosephosphate isomerase [Breoghania corrubedonensis]|uniref:Triosephosphate isomerase n=1 Tax=Breoghania corrubedonensis TaxID=665038 RepID=A0A2T5VBN7_9HYPH|nr:triose-phosphate isomerase [Breoghania corrubedonensis]PTW61160.1 triosephosphate isomerase [Breoghania corrubedonensis]